MSEEQTAVSVNVEASDASRSALPAAPFGSVVKKLLRPLEYFTQVNGRARRGEFWTTALLVLLPATMLTLIFSIVALASGNVFIYAVLSLPTTALGLLILPVAVRRWHDLGVTGWLAVAAQGIMWFPISAIPILGALLGFLASVACIVFFCLPGRKGYNAYGADPCDPAAVDPADARHEAWLPFVLVYFGMAFVNWCWSIYALFIAIDGVRSSFRSLGGLENLF